MKRKRKEVSLRRRLLMALLVPSLIVGAGALAALLPLVTLPHAGVDDTVTTRPSAPVVSPDREAQLIAMHHCWRNEAPPDMAGKFPGHAVVSRRSGHPVYVGPVGAGKALDQVFGKGSSYTQVHAFCR